MRLAIALSTLTLAGLGCGADQSRLDPYRAIPRGTLGRPVLSLHWRLALAATLSEVNPVDFASPTVLPGSSRSDEFIYVGSQQGWFFALDGNAEVVWKRRLGAVGTNPVYHAESNRLYVGSEDGRIHCMTPSGENEWSYISRGPILRPPVLADDLLVFSNESDQVLTLDRKTGDFRWQYKVDTPEEFTLRGHAGVAFDGEYFYTAFANGTLVALRPSNGSVAWSTSIKGTATRFVDADVTPVVTGQRLYAASSTGGVFAVDRKNGQVLWNVPIAGVGALIADDEDRLYVAAAENGVYAMDLAGSVLWRQGTRHGGEPSGLLIAGEYLIYSFSARGLFVADRKTGRLLQFFDPGFGISGEPQVSGRTLYFVSNSSVLYRFGLRHFESD